MEAAKRLSLYQELSVLPDGTTGEILNGRLHTQPRPKWPHGRAEDALLIELGTAYDRGKRGPGGWWIITEPEIHFVRDTEVVVPDLAGWRRSRMPSPPSGHRVVVPPDWVCEILSPSTASKDRDIKMPLYHHYGVKYFWLVDPTARTLEAFEADREGWNSLDRFTDGDRVSVAPFAEAVFTLAELWD